MDPLQGDTLRLLSNFDADHLSKRLERPYADVLPYVREAQELNRRFHALCGANRRRSERWLDEYNTGLLSLSSRMLRELTPALTRQTAVPTPT